MDDVIDLKAEKICPFLSAVIKEPVKNQTGVLAHPCLTNNCKIYDLKRGDCGLKNGVDSAE